MKKMRNSIIGFWNSSRTNKLIAIGIAGVVLFAGIAFVVTKAIGYFASVESDTGTLTGNAKIINEAGASGGQALQFTAPPQGGGSALTSRPNDGTKYWPDFSNTGYKNTPANVAGLGLPAYSALTDYTSGMTKDKYLRIEYPNGSVVAYKRFLASKMEIFGDNLTFIGCLFEGESPNDNLVQIYADTSIKFYYSTFKPAAYSLPPGNNGSVTSSPTAPGTPYDKSWQLVTTMKNAVATMDHNDIWGNAGMIVVTGRPDRPSTWTNNYIHDAADNDTSTFNDTSGTPYHHDGIGPQSEGDGGHMIVDHNTIATKGNTNGLALQGTGVYTNVKVTNNYISGWGYALSIGTINNANNITVTGNVFSGELPQLYGFLYGNLWGGSARGSTWRNNVYQVRAGDHHGSLTTSDHGKYAWPSDNSGHTGDYGG